MIGKIIRVVFVLIATLIAGVALLLHAPFLRKEALQMIEASLEKSMRGDVSLGRLEGILLHRATLRGVEIRDSEGRTVISADMVRLDPDLLSLILDRQLRFDNLQLVGPRIYLRTDEQGRLNLSELFVKKEAAPTAKKKTGFTPIPIDVVHARIIDGTFWYEPHRGVPQRADDIDVSLNAAIRTERIDLALLSLELLPSAYPSRIRLHGRATVLPKQVLAPELIFSDAFGSSGRIEEAVHELDTGSIKGRFQVNARAASLRAATKQKALRGHLSLEGSLDHPAGDAPWTIDAKGKLNRAPVSLSAKASPDFKELSADLDLRGPIDPSELFEGAPKGPLQGTISATLRDTDPLAGELHADLSGELQYDPKQPPLVVRGLDVDAAAKDGRLRASGSVNSDKVQARFDVQGKLQKELDLAVKLDAKGERLHPNLQRFAVTATADVEGTNVRAVVDRLEATTLDQQWRSSGRPVIEATQAKRGWIVTARGLNLASRTGRIEVSGRADVGRKKIQRADVTVEQLDIGELQRALKMDPMMEGKVDAKIAVENDRDIDGTIALTMDRRQVANASIDLTTRGLAKIAEADGKVALNLTSFPLSAVKMRETITGTVSGSATLVKRGKAIDVDLDARTSELWWDRRWPKLRVAVDAQMRRGKVGLDGSIEGGPAGKVYVKAIADAPADPTVIAAWTKLDLDALRTAHVRIENSDLAAWTQLLEMDRLSGKASADIALGRGAKRLEGNIGLRRVVLPKLERPLDLQATFESSEGRSHLHADVFDQRKPMLAVEASLPRDLLQLSKTSTLAMMKLPVKGEVHADHLPVQLIAYALGAGDASGSISMDGRLTGSLADPLFHVQISSSDAAIRSAVFRKIQGHAELTKTRLASRMVMEQKHGGRLDLDARVGLKKGARIDGHIGAHEFDLGFLSLLAPKTKGTLGGVAGKLDADLALSGTQQQPHLEGVLKVEGLRAVMQYPVPPVEKTSIDLRFKEDKIIFGIEGRSGDGSFEITGNGSLPTLDKPKLSGKIEVKELSLAAGPRLVETDLDAQWHVVSKDSTIEADVIIVDGSARMESGAEKLAPVKRFDNVVLVDRLGDELGPTPDEAKEKKLDPIDTKTKIVLRVKTEEEIPLRSDDVNASVDVDLLVQTTDAGAVASGAITVTDGTLALFGGRRWTIEKAEIRFPGGAKAEPTLAVRIYHDFSDAVVWVHVDGKPSAPQIRFTSDPAIYSRDQLLGFVLGGSPDAAPSDASLGERATGVAAGFLVGQIQSKIKDKLPIDTLSVDMEDGARASAVLVGKWITERLFLAYNYRIEAEEEENASEGIVRVLFGHGWILEAAYGDRGNGAADVLWITRF